MFFIPAYQKKIKILKKILKWGSKSYNDHYRQQIAYVINKQTKKKSIF